VCAGLSPLPGLMCFSGIDTQGSRPGKSGCAKRRRRERTLGAPGMGAEQEVNLERR
jgi:hypothetical protein